MDKLAHNTREYRILRMLRSSKASEILYHHRFPTSTENVRNACHPFSTKENFGKNYVLVHNGVIWNSEELVNRHKKLGINYISTQPTGQFNDSEALLYDVALYLEGKQDVLHAEGDIAFIVVENESGKPSKLHFGRNTGSPLYMDFTRKGMSLASVLDKKQQGHLLPANMLHTFDYETFRLTQQALDIPEYWRSNWKPKSKPTHSYASYEGSGTYLPSSKGANTGASTYSPRAREDGEDTYWDGELQRYVALSELTYGSDSYYAMVADKGETMAMDLLAETGNLDEAMKIANNKRDSLVGKLTRINNNSLSHRVGSRKLNKLNKERMTIWTQSEITEEAIAQLQEVVSEEARLVVSAMQSRGESEAQQVARIIEETLAIDEQNDTKREMLNLAGGQ